MEGVIILRKEIDHETPRFNTFCANMAQIGPKPTPQDVLRCLHSARLLAVQNREVRVSPEKGQIGPKCDKSGTF